VVLRCYSEVTQLENVTAIEFLQQSGLKQPKYLLNTHVYHTGSCGLTELIRNYAARERGVYYVSATDLVTINAKFADGSRLQH
jgi:hypothetical protein